jgi:hypothetical protein
LADEKAVDGDGFTVMEYTPVAPEQPFAVGVIV